MQRRTLLGVAAALALTAVVAGVVLAVTDDGDTGARGVPTAVDVGFAQDMLVHHQQAVVMAAYAREFGASEQVRAMAAAIDAAQQREIGQLTGWLQSWGEPIQSERLPMHWMAGDGAGHHGDPGSMPGMASPEEMDQLVNLTGRRLDTLFLKLMTRHHEGGLPMAEDAARRAGTSYVRDAARTMLIDQRREIDQMRLLSATGSATG